MIIIYGIVVTIFGRIFECDISYYIIMAAIIVGDALNDVTHEVRKFRDEFERWRKYSKQ